jgi:phenylalanyl-tRNA synthetase beta chain
VDPEKDSLFRGDGIVPARLANPMAEDASLLRSSGAVTMAAALEWNLNHGQRNVRLFEIARHYQWRGREPVESRTLTLGATGLAREQGVQETEREYSFADMKGDLDQLAELAGGLRWSSGGPGWLHPAHAASVALAAPAAGTNGAVIGVAGQLARRVAARFKLRQDVFLAELALDPLYAGYRAARAGLRYQPLSRFPAVERDFSLILADGTTFAQVAEAIHSLDIAEVAGIEALDLFRGGHIPAEKYSLLVRVTFESHQATLTEAQLAEFTGRIVAALESRLGATLRTT